MLKAFLQDFTNSQSKNFTAHQFRVLRSIQADISRAQPIDIKMNSLNLFSAGNFLAFLYFNPNNTNMFQYRTELNSNPRLALNTFLNSKSIGLVVLDETARELAKEIGIFRQINNFEAGFENYGFTQILSQNPEIKIYKKNSSFK